MTNINLVLNISTKMPYKSFKKILTLYGFSAHTSLLYYYSNLLLVLSILNFGTSLVYFNVIELSNFNITDLIKTAATNILQVTHCVILLCSVRNIGLGDKFSAEIYDFDHQIYVTFHFKIKRQDEIRLNYKLLGGWAISALSMSFATFHVITGGVYISLWFRVLPGILAAQLKYVQIFFHLELLKQRLKVIADVLEKLDNEETIIEFKVAELKKLYTKLMDIMDLINRLFGTDLIFLVIHNFNEIIFNVYLIFLDGCYLHDYSNARGRKFVVNYLTTVSTVFLFITVSSQVILLDAVYNLMLARSCDGCNFMVNSIFTLYST